jgi:hypothetical protein
LWESSTVVPLLAILAERKAMVFGRALISVSEEYRARPETGWRFQFGVPGEAGRFQVLAEFDARTRDLTVPLTRVPFDPVLRVPAGSVLAVRIVRTGHAKPLLGFIIEEAQGASGSA